MNARLPTTTDGRTDDVAVRAARLAEVAASVAMPASLTARAIDYLTSSPHRYLTLARADELPHATDDPLRVELEALEATLNLRLALQHDALSPRDVGVEVARATQAALVTLAEREDARLLAARPRLPEAAVVRCDAARLLHPLPPFVAPGRALASTDPAALDGLVRAHERLRDRPVPLATFLARKLRQHVQFYRFGAGLLPYAWRRARIARRLPPEIRAHEGLRETFSAIEQLGPVLDNFVFGCGLSASSNDDVGVSDLTFLYMQLADELVDNLVRLGGEPALSRLLDATYAPAVRASLFVPLEDLGPEALRTVGIDPGAHVPKYDLTVEGLLDVLRALRHALLQAIADTAEPEPVRAQVSSFFHHCFATFLDELELAAMTGEPRLDRLPYPAVAWHFHRKNDEVMTRSMALRARLLGLPEARVRTALSRWGSLLASFQIFDDLKDLAVDLGHQPSYPLAFAHVHRPDELARIEEALRGDTLALDRNEVLRLSVVAAGTVHRCLQWARLLALSRFDWFVDYVADVRWRRNWLLRRGSFHRAPRHDATLGELVPAAAVGCGEPALDVLFGFFAAVDPRFLEEVRFDLALGHAFEVVAYDHASALAWAAWPDLRLAYRVRTLRMRLTPEEKLDVLRALVRRSPAGARRGLEAVRRVRGDTARALAEALELPMPGLYLPAL